MKLVLSSCDFLEAAPRRVILENLPKPPEDCRVLFIPNEHATPENLKNDMYNRRLRQKGFKRNNVCVFDHTRPRDFFGLPLDLVYISGGNTFLTIEKLRKTGFDRELLRLVRAGVLYVGGSAGAHIVTADLRHLVRYDAPPDGFADFSGLGLVDFILVCHFGPDRAAHFEELKKTSSRPVFALGNCDSIVFSDGNVAVFRGEKEEPQ